MINNIVVVRIPVNEQKSHLWYKYTYDNLVLHNIPIIPYLYTNIEEYTDYFKIISLLRKNELYNSELTRLIIIDAGMIIKYNINYNSDKDDIEDVAYIREIRYGVSVHRILYARIDDDAIIQGRFKPKIYPIKSGKSYVINPYFIWADNEALNELKILENSILPLTSFDYIHKAMNVMYTIDGKQNIDQKAYEYIDGLYKRTTSKKYLSWMLYILALKQKKFHNVDDSIDLLENSIKYDKRIDNLYLISSLYSNRISHTIGIEYLNMASMLIEKCFHHNYKHVYVPLNIINSIDTDLSLHINIKLNEHVKYDKNRSSPLLENSMQINEYSTYNKICERLIMSNNDRICKQKLYGMQYIYAKIIEPCYIISIPSEYIVKSFIIREYSDIFVINITRNHLNYIRLNMDTHMMSAENVVEFKSFRLMDLLTMASLAHIDISKYKYIDVIKGTKSWWIKMPNNCVYRMFDLIHFSPFQWPLKTYELEVPNKTINNWYVSDNKLKTHSYNNISVGFNDGDEPITMPNIHKNIPYANPDLNIYSSLSSSKLLCKLNKNNKQNYIPYRIIRNKHDETRISFPFHIIYYNSITKILSMCYLSNFQYICLLYSQNKYILSTVSIKNI